MSYRKACVALSGLLLACSATRTAKADIVSTIEDAASGSTISVSGTYSVTVPIYVPAGVTINGPATFNFNKAANGIILQKGNDHLNELTVTNSGNVGIYVYESANNVVNSCIAEGNANTGIQVQGSGASNNSIQYSQAYNNIDTATDGQNADGIDVKFGAGTGNVLKNDISQNNADDGYDFWEAGNVVTVTSCQSYSNGKLTEGNGNGFKMGAAGDDIAHVYTSCIAHNNSSPNDTGGSGFTTNGNTGKCKLTTCHSYSNQSNDVLGNSVLSNCTMQT
jgi:parallel beta-helix repeat protein